MFYNYNLSVSYSPKELYDLATLMNIQELPKFPVGGYIEISVWMMSYIDSVKLQPKLMFYEKGKQEENKFIFNIFHEDEALSTVLHMKVGQGQCSKCTDICDNGQFPRGNLKHLYIERATETMIRVCV
ncbi:hypothetical protein PFISCL1PPCAC_4141, partial [Pristionchus fissidentatus]